MYTYNMTQWLAFFLIYCFLGWCWECCFVSFQKKKWVNRGFMHGPLLPIYGSGAVTILFVALPFQKSVAAVYFAGLIAATLLEYVTGVLMESLFQVRYWDYSDQKFNFQGHICLTSSIAWGFFSIAMVYGFHKPFERLVLSVPEAVLSPVIHIIMVLAAADFAISFKTAIELRDILVKLEKAKHEMRLMQKRLEVIEAILADEQQQKRERQREQREQFMEQLKESGNQVVEAGRELKDQMLEAGRELRETGKEWTEQMAELTESKKEELRGELSDLKKRMGAISLLQQEKRYMTKDKLDMLRRNPSATSAKYAQAFDEFRYETWPELKAELTEKIKDKLGR